MILDERTYGYHQPKCPLWPKSFPDQHWIEEKESHWRKGEKIFPSQLSVQKERTFDMVDLNTFSIISKQEVSPAAVFLFGGGGGDPASTVMDKCCTIFFPLIFWPESKNWHYKCPMISSKLPWHSETPAPGVSCLSSVSGCALVVVSQGLLTIRVHWPFCQECGGGTRKREREIK